MRLLRCLHEGCRNANGSSNVIKGEYAAFVVNGFSNWKKALDRFSTHERSELHKAAVLALSAVSKGTPISSRLNAQRQREMNDARQSLSMIFSTLRFLASFNRINACIVLCV